MINHGSNLLSQDEIAALMDDIDLIEDTGDTGGGGSSAELSHDDKDAIQEFGNIGMGAAVRDMASTFPDLKIFDPDVHVVDPDEINQMYLSDGGVKITQEFTSVFQGNVTYILRGQDAIDVANALTGLEHEELTDALLDPINDFIGGLSSTFFQASGEMLGQEVHVESPVANVIDTNNSGVDPNSVEIRYNLQVPGKSPSYIAQIYPMSEALRIQQILLDQFSGADDEINMDSGSTDNNIDESGIANQLVGNELEKLSTGDAMNNPMQTPPPVQNYQQPVQAAYGQQQPIQGTPPPQQQMGYPPPPQGYPPQQQMGYPPPPQGYPPQQQMGYPPQQMGYPPAGGYPPPMPGYPPPYQQDFSYAKFKDIELSRGGVDVESPESSDKKKIQLLMDVSLTVTVELGRTTRKIRDIVELGVGSVVELDKLAGESVELMVNQKLIAKGEVVIIDENFGLRITSIISPSERLNQLSG